MNKPRKKEFKKVCLFCGKNYLGITEKSRFCSKNCEKSYYYKQNYVPKPIKYITKIFLIAKMNSNVKLLSQTKNSVQEHVEICIIRNIVVKNREKTIKLLKLYEARLK